MTCFCGGTDAWLWMLRASTRSHEHGIWMVDRRRISVQPGSMARMPSVMSTLPRGRGPQPCSSFSMSGLNDVGLERRAWSKVAHLKSHRVSRCEGQGPPARMTGQRLVKSQSTSGYETRWCPESQRGPTCRSREVHVMHPLSVEMTICRRPFEIATLHVCRPLNSRNLYSVTSFIQRWRMFASARLHHHLVGDHRARLVDE